MNYDNMIIILGHEDIKGKKHGIIEKVKDFMDSELPEGPNKTMK